MTSEIKWREVTEAEYFASSNREAPHRIAFGPDLGTVYELGSTPTKAPTGQYALVVPAPYVRKNDYYFYINIDEQWWQIDPDDLVDVDTVTTGEVEAMLNNNNAEGGKPTHVIGFTGI